jgi:hypothetical protein
MKLFLVHCGYYDNDVCDGIYESHVNFFVSAVDFTEARTNAKLIPDFIDKKMHVDGLQEIQAVDGFRIELVQDLSLQNSTQIVNFKHRDLAPQGK